MPHAAWLFGFAQALDTTAPDKDALEVILDHQSALQQYFVAQVRASPRHTILSGTGVGPKRSLKIAAA
jgi:hypothetical protein